MVKAKRNKKKKAIVDIDGRDYELKKCHQLKKLGGYTLGKVPVRMFTRLGFMDFIRDATSNDLDIIIPAFRYGLGVFLQKDARTLDAGGGYTNEEHNKIFNELSEANPDWLRGFAGKGNELDDACKAEWNRRHAEQRHEYDDNYIWKGFAFIFSDEITPPTSDDSNDNDDDDESVQYDDDIEDDDEEDDDGDDNSDATELTSSNVEHVS